MPLLYWHLLFNTMHFKDFPEEIIYSLSANELFKLPGYKYSYIVQSRQFLVSHAGHYFNSIVPGM